MKKEQNKREIGNVGEKATADLLIKNGYDIVKRNYTVRGGEIDIIAKNNSTVAFVEVKTRASGSLDDGVGAITPVKKKHIIKAAERYLFETDIECDCRFDVAIVEISENTVKHIRYYVSAFDASK